MELWIRSQDKETLVKCNDYINYFYDDLVFDDAKKIHCIGTKIFTLGAYKTKERAIKVLDEIQNILKPKFIMNIPNTKSVANCLQEQTMILQNYDNNAKIEELSTYVYQMPEE